MGSANLNRTPSEASIISLGWVIFLQPARRASLLGLFSSLRPHWATLRKTEKRANLLTGVGEGVVEARSRLRRPQESLVLYKSFNILWFSLTAGGGTRCCCYPCYQLSCSLSWRPVLSTATLRYVILFLSTVPSRHLENVL